jgi:hypothetical protein
MGGGWTVSIIFIDETKDLWSSNVAAATFQVFDGAR